MSACRAIDALEEMSTVTIKRSRRDVTRPGNITKKKQVLVIYMKEIITRVSV